VAASRKIEVQLVGDAGDLERSLAGALASLKTFGDGAQKSGSKTSLFSKSTKDAERGLYDFDKAASKVNKTMSGGPFNLFDAIGNVGYGLLRLGGFAQNAGASFGDLFKGLSTGEAGLTGIGSAIGQLGPILGIAAGGAVAFGAALLVLPALAAAATFVLTALLDVVTILTAAMVAFAGPLLVATGLLGGLGAAFAFVAVQSFKTSATQQQVHDNLLALHVAQQTYNQDLAKYGKNATQTENALIALHKAQDAYETSLFGVQLNLGKLHDQFSNLIDTLGKRFRPELLQLAGAASQALTYLNRIAKLPLKQAFESLGTEGVAMLNKFVYGVANVLKKPFRLAIEVAFGSGGSNANTAIASWWNSLTNYLFGYTKTRPIHIGSQIVMDTKNVKGALQPVIDFFNSLHLTDTGLRWGHDIIQGVINAWNNDKGLRTAVKAIFHDAAQEAVRAFKAAFWAEIHGISWRSLALWIAHQLSFTEALIRLAKQAWPTIKSMATNAFHSIASNISNIAGSIGSSIENHIGAAWQYVKNKASNVWNWIKNLVESVLTVNISWPSPPAWLETVFGMGGSSNTAVTGSGGGRFGHRAMGGPVMAGVPYIVGERRPEVFVPNTNGRILPNAGGWQVTVNAPNARILDQAFVRDLSRELNRLQARHA
jgi:hypothetical protein